MNRVDKCLQELETGNMQKAFQLIDEIHDNGIDQEQYELASQLSRLGFLEEAVKLYKKLLEKYPHEGELAVLLAEALVDLDKEEEALLVLENISKGDPYYPQVLLIQADIYQMEGLYEVAEQKLLEAEKILPKEPVIQFALAELYASIGRFAEAAYKYELVLKENFTSNGINLYHRLADTYSAAGEFEKALSYYEKALEDQLDIDVLFGFGFTAYQAGYYQTAIQKFEEIKTLDPDYQSVYLLLAKAYEHEEELKKSMETVKEGLKVNPYQKELYYFGGKIALKLGNKDEAEHYLKKALEQDPNYIEALLTLSKILLAHEKYSELIEIVEPVLQEGDEDPELLWDIAVACQKEERYSDALKYYRQAYNDLKGREEFLQNYGFFLLEAGLSDEAIEIFKQLQKMDSANPEYVDILERLEND